jgi:hypothetical protein
VQLGPRSLLTLGCCDPVNRIEWVKAQDPHRQQVAELFQVWSQCHGDAPVKVADLAKPVEKVIDPHCRGRQYVASRLSSLIGTRSAGFGLTRQNAAGTWGAATYALSRIDAEVHEGLRDHRGHRAPMVPMPPMPDALDRERSSDSRCADFLREIEI